MNKIIVVLTIFLLSCTAFAQKMDIHKYTNFERYQKNNMEILKTENKAQVVFMGNSITDAWPRKSPDFFNNNGYVGRGISGQVSSQMLLRFRADVIDLNPKVVVILSGINDIAQNSGFVELETIAANISSMAELADYHGIKVILCSVLPAIDFPWHRGLNPAEKVIKLNQMIKKYADEKQFEYVDYYSAMVDDKGGLKVPEYTSQDDLVHPNADGYKVMEKLVKPTIDEALAQ